MYTYPGSHVAGRRLARSNRPTPCLGTGKFGGLGPLFGTMTIRIAVVLMSGRKADVDVTPGSSLEDLRLRAQQLLGVRGRLLSASGDRLAGELTAPGLKYDNRIQYNRRLHIILYNVMILLLMTMIIMIIAVQMSHASKD